MNTEDGRMKSCENCRKRSAITDKGYVWCDGYGKATCTEEFIEAAKNCMEYEPESTGEIEAI